MDLRKQLTEQQFAAIFLKDASVSLSAGAGCGKTFVLTQRFLARLEPQPDFPTADLHSLLHSLVAITFTERAAREMRDRIRDACHKRLRDCPEEQAEHWLKILRGLDSARITTIHSFCAGLLRSQAVAAGLDPGFKVLEPSLAATLLQQVVRKTIYKLIETEDPDAAELVIQFGLERTIDLLQTLTIQRFSTRWSERAQITPESLAADWQNLWEKEFVPKLVARFRESPTVALTLQAIADRPSRHEVMQERMATLSEWLSPTVVWQDPVHVLKLINDHARVQGGGAKKDWHSDGHQERVKLAFEQLRKESQKLLETLSFRPEDVAAAARNSCRAAGLVEQIATQFAAAKAEQSALDFDDLLKQTCDLLRDHADVRRRVSAGIRLLMVDEFQDTDDVQADIVRFLCDEKLKSGKLFMVGDQKQSIYRFRRANPTVFTTIRDEVPPAGRLSLSVNFRSQPTILNFVNFLFASAIPSYEPLSPHTDLQQSPPPAIELLLATSDADKPTTPPTETDRHDHEPGAAELRAREADWIARRIQELLDDRTPKIRSAERDADGQPTLRPVERKDIVILFRALSNVQEYEAALRNYDIDYYLVGGRAFFAQQEVFDLLNLCRYLDDCDDLIALAGILRSPFFNLSDDSLQALGDSSNSPGDSVPSGPLTIHDTLYREPPAYLPDEQRDRIRFAARILTELRSSKDRMPLSRILTTAIEKTGYDASLLLEFLGVRKLANLRKLIDMARQFEDGEFFTLKDFVTRLQDSVLEETNEEFATTLAESDEVVRLMSIHQSKGLEFPVVIVADIDRKGPPRRSDAVLHAELGPLIKPPSQFGSQADHLGLKMHHIAESEADSAETIRLFYVACTRAADYLILSAGRVPGKPAQSPWMQLIESRFHLDSGLPKFDSLLGASAAGTAGRDTIPEIFCHRIPPQVQSRAATRKRQIPAGQLPARILSAAPAELPVSAERFAPDYADLSVISVSRIEKIDEELSGFPHRKVIRDSDDWQADDIAVDQATSLGTLVHTVLEQIDFRNPSSWPDLLMIAANQIKESNQLEILEQARSLLERFFDSKLPAEFSQAKSVHKEIDFLLPWESCRADANELAEPRGPSITGIIDLLLETETGWQILDYKTGEFPKNATAEQLLAPYLLQLSVYAKAVEQWIGESPREVSLIVFRPQVRRIKLPWSEAIWNQARTRIDRALASMRHELPGS